MDDANALVESEARYLGLAQMCGQAVLIECADEIVFANGASLPLSGLEEVEDLIGRKIVDLIPSFVRPPQDAGGNGQPPAFTRHLLARADGSAIDVDMAAAACAFQRRDAVQMVLRRAFAAPDTRPGARERLLFKDRVAHAIVATERSGKLLAVMMLGIDHPSSTEQSRGSVDDVLRDVAGRLAGDTRKTDSILTVGRNEFAIVVEAMAEPELAAMVARRKLDAVSAAVEGAPGRATASIGIAILTPEVRDAEGLIGNAERALWAARNAGGNTFKVYSAGIESDALRHGGPRPETATRLERLTPREHEVLAMLVDGRPSKTIAHLLGTSTRTIDVHRARVMEKMCADSVASLVAMVVEERALARVMDSPK